MKKIVLLFIVLLNINLVSAQTLGCTNQIACNYAPIATIDDGSCIYVSNPALDMTIGTWNMDLDNSCLNGNNSFTYNTIAFNSNGTTTIGTTSYNWSMCGDTLTILSFSGTYKFILTYSNGVFTGYYYSNGNLYYCAILTANIIPCLAVPYFENFDVGTGTTVNNGWIRNSGGTISLGTGPSDDITGGGYYMYYETSGSPQNPVTISTECLDISSLTNPCLKWNYHMYGSSMGCGAQGSS